MCLEKEQAALLQVRAEQELITERESEREGEREREREGVMVQKQLEHRQAAARWEEAERAMMQELRVLREENARLQQCVLSLAAAGEGHLNHGQAQKSRCPESAEPNRAWTQRAGKAKRKEGAEHDGNEDVRGQARARAREEMRARERERDVRVAIVREIEIKLSGSQGDVVGMADGAAGGGGGKEGGVVRGEGRKVKEELEEEAEAQEVAGEALWMQQNRLLLRGARSPVEGAEQGFGFRV